MRTFIAFLALSRLANALDDLTVYTDNSLASGWENWSWNSEVDFAASDIVSGSSGTAIAVKSDAWAALSLKLSQGTFAAYAGLKFEIAGNQPEVQIIFQSTADDASSPGVPLSEISKTIVGTAFTSALVDFAALPGSGSPLGNGTWDRITFQALGNGASYHLDNVVLVPVSLLFPSDAYLKSHDNVVAVTYNKEKSTSALFKFF
ncbi:hypothetical protein NMY22_g8380 [Coprinellus aureogranulatus]|nr:hypothetical protein NMY22_g8380 [Coprinellus aureogranulatus]